jgi:hypothetical protein
MIAAETLRHLIAAARRILRTRRDEHVPDAGINLSFDAGIIATCRRCHISWRVSRSHFEHVEWWACPSGCGRKPQPYKTGM